ncbi:MAG TPA: RidA family protein [Acidimicrobiales bacterium]|nr:RidA family protein [Acidimicrobiales bacterium]
MTRRSIDVESFRHTNPIPGACRVGPLLVSSVISGRDPASDNLPDDAGAQVANVFHHVGEMLAAAGAGWEHIVRMSFFVPDIAIRSMLNGPWLERFPDPESRPARHTQVTPGVTVSCEFIAYIEE